MSTYKVYYHNVDEDNRKNWGKNWKTKGDVTSIFNTKIMNPYITALKNNTPLSSTFPVNNSTFGDTMPGTYKYFYISIDNATPVKIAGENQSVSFNDANVQKIVKMLRPPLTTEQSKAVSTVTTASSNATYETTGQRAADEIAAQKKAADDSAKAAAEEKARIEKSKDDAINAANNEANGVKNILDTKFQANVFSFLTGLFKKEADDLATINTPLPANALPPLLSDSELQALSADDLNKVKEKLSSDFSKAFGFTKFNNTAAKSYHSKCVGVSEYTTDSYAMTPLDDFYHTPSSCKINATIQGNKYFALMKPANVSKDVDSNYYKCYVANEPPSATTSYYDYVTIWSIPANIPSNQGITISSIAINEWGDFIINYSSNPYNMTNNQKKLSSSYFDATTGKPLYKTYLKFTNNANIEVHCVKDDVDKIVWNLFSDDKRAQLNMMNLAPAPQQNPEWNNRNNNTLYQGDTMPGTVSYLTSNDGTYKLEISNGVLRIKTTVYACKSDDPTYTKIPGDDSLRNNPTLFTVQNTDSTKGQPYYVRQIKQGDPKINQTYYEISGPGYQQLQPIDASNPTVQKGNNFTKYEEYYPSSDVIDKHTLGDVDSCKAACIKDNNCTYLYSYQKDGQTYCATGSATPVFRPQQPGAGKTKSDLYIREPAILLDNSMIQPGMNNPVDVVVKDNIAGYSSYNIGNAVTESVSWGAKNLPLYKQAMSRDEIIRCGTVGGCAKVEGFNNYGYQNPTNECSDSDPNKVGCQPAIFNNQLNPLIQISSDYNGQVKQMTQLSKDIQTNITNYNNVRSRLINEKDDKYDFNANNKSFSKEDKSLLNAMQQDSKQMALEQTNLYIAGSILTTTLLISAIYLGRE
jgi:hypothetical protein